jgi:branched-chain amino acid transport system substrate-binding protein
MAFAETPIRVGATISLEGHYKDLSFMVRSGYELWADQVNSKGGLLGRRVELLFYNDKSRKDLVGPLYEKLITEDKVDMILSPYGSTLTLAAAEVAEKHGYILLAASASSLKIWEQGFRYVFGVYSTADRYFVGFLDLVARKQLRNIAVIHSDETFHVSAAKGIDRWAHLFGLEVVYKKQFTRNNEELPAIVAELGNQQLDSIIFCGYPLACYQFLSLLEQHSLKPPGIALTIAPAMQEFYRQVGAFAENIFGPSQWEADERIPFPGTVQFITNFYIKYNMKPSYQACSSYSSGQILENAVNQAGKIDHALIREYVASLDTVTIMGRFKVDNTGRQVGHNPIVVQWQNGNKEIVYPTKMQTAPARFNSRGIQQ